jgi:prophage regulatory protein
MLRLADVVNRVGASASTIWRMEKAGSFPKRRRIGQQLVGWLESEVEEWLRQTRRVAA